MPASPSSASRMRVPSSTPFGMLMESVRSFVWRPVPPQPWQGSSITSPRPWQEMQARSMAKKPCCARMRPEPPQVGQVFGLVPGLAPEPVQMSQVTLVGTRISAALPWNASSSVISMS